MTTTDATRKHEAGDGLGLPYASAEFDDSGYHVVCPVCGWKAYPEGGHNEDDVTKGANLAYAGHFTNEEKAGR
jgi:hypothetical protein